MKKSRDKELGERLGRLDDCPPPKPGFEARVWERIEAEAAQAPVGQARAFGARHRRRPLLVAAVAAVAAVLVASVVLFGLPGAGDKTGPAPVSAAVVSARMAEAMSSYRTLQGTMTTSGNAAYVDGGTFATDAAGDFSLRFAAGPAAAAAKAQESSQPLVLTYNAQRHVQINTYVEPSGRRVSYGWDQALPYEGIGVSGWTHPYPPGLAWLVRAALADGDPRVTVDDTVFDGRSAWKVSLPSISYFGYLKGMSFVVDSRTGFLVQWTTPPDPANPGSGGTSLLTDLRVDQPLPADAFSVAVPRGAKLGGQERNQYYCTLDQVPARVGFRPFLPSNLPSGYRLSDVATDPRTPGDFLGWQGPDPGTHAPHTEAFLRYSHGADSFTVHVASTAAYSRSEVAGYFRGLTDFPAYGSALLRAGSFAGLTAQTWFDINGANLVVVGKAYVVYISGSLTRRELYEVANSLQQS
jgi:hypothetical protein